MEEDATRCGNAAVRRGAEAEAEGGLMTLEAEKVSGKVLAREGRWLVPKEDRPSGWENMSLEEPEISTDEPIGEPIDEHPLVIACRKIPKEILPGVLSTLTKISDGQKAELALFDMAIGLMEIILHLDSQRKRISAIAGGQ